MTGDESSARVFRAQARYDEAVRAERRARVAAAPELRRRAARRRGGARVFSWICVVVVVVLVAAAVAAVWSGHGDQRRLDADAQTRDAASSAVVTMLTADPAKADDYVDGILEVTAGAQHRRIEAARVQLRDVVAAQSRPSTGQVLSAGVVDRMGDDATVLLVAQASDPELVGASAVDQRIVLRITMTRSDGRWLMTNSEPVS